MLFVLLLICPLNVFSCLLFVCCCCLVNGLRLSLFVVRCLFRVVRCLLCVCSFASLTVAVVWYLLLVACRSLFIVCSLLVVFC